MDRIVCFRQRFIKLPCFSLYVQQFNVKDIVRIVYPKTIFRIQCESKNVMLNENESTSPLSSTEQQQQQKQLHHRQNNNYISSQTSAGIIIIGDEILKGHTKDTNAAFLLSRLWANGVTVNKVSFIADDVTKIANEVAEFSKTYSFVITAGGIGPTHDDMTCEGISKAFNDPLVINDDLKTMIENISQKKVLSSSLLKMAVVPSSTELVIGTDPLTQKVMKYPLLRINNVYVFPGVPAYLQKSFLVNEYLFSGGGKFCLTKIYVSADEEMIAETIEKISKMFSTVHLGSYPMINDTYKVKITLESEDQESLELAYNNLIERLPKDIIVSVKKCLPNSRDEHHEIFNTSKARKLWNPSVSYLNSLSLVDLDHYLSKSNTTNLSIAIKCAWAVLNQTLQLYSMDEICIGFNGGKDCTAVLHLYVAFVKKMFPDNSKKLIGLYLKHSDPFQEANEFINNCETNYDLEMIVLPSSIKEGLEKLKVSHSKLKAVIMGTRRHDPYSSNLRSFTMTDEGWPQYMRVFPVLDWSYCEIWEFLRTFDLPYCNLYNEGYTSLGSKSNTFKNPLLRLENGNYSPAYLLEEECSERDGRGVK